MEFQIEDDNIALKSAEGVVLAEVTFPMTEPGVVDINHTFVDDSLRGQGIAGKLMEELVTNLRLTGRKAALTCSYAEKWFDRHPECVDVLKER